MKQRDGFILIAALWLIVALSAVALDAALRSQPRRIAAANQLDIVRAREAAHAGGEYARSRLTAALLQQAERLRQEVEQQARRSGGTVTRRGNEWVINGPTFTVPSRTFADDPWFDPQGLVPPGMHLGDAQFTLDVHDTGIYVNINEVSEDELRAFLAQGLRIDFALADKITQSMMDWRDADDLPRINGGEREQYIKEGMPTIPLNHTFSSVDEVRGVLHMTPEVYAAMRPYITVVGSGRINMNAAAEAVLLAVPSMTPAAAAQLVRLRSGGRYPRNLADMRALLGTAFRPPAGQATTLFNRRATFATNEVEIVSRGGVAGSPIQATAYTVVAKTNNAAVVLFRKVDQ